MGRRKIEIKPIPDDRNRSVTFLKRKGGLFKKAFELAVLCSVDVTVMIYSNKKLYQFCSGDVNEMIHRHSYFDAPHENKTKKDFENKANDDDDDDGMLMDPDADRAGSHSSDGHPPPHLQHGMNPTASISPPMPNQRLPPGYQPRMGTPQPATRPSSRNTIRRNSSNLVPPNGYPAAQPPPPHPHPHPHPQHVNGYSYMPQHQQQIPQPQRMAQHQAQQPIPAFTQSMMPQSNMSHVSYPQFHPHNTMPHHQPQTVAQAQAEAFINEPPAPEPDQPPRDAPAPAPQLPEKRAPAKSRSMYTPIGPSESMLAQHFGGGRFAEESSISNLNNNPVSTSAPSSEPASTLANFPSSIPAISTSLPPLPHVTTTSPPPPRNNSLSDPKSAGQRPKLKVQIPSENSDAASPSSSAKESGNAGTLSARPDNDRVLPPPSPVHSVGTLLSAGATGPPNPFSRRVNSSQPGETPISALPSKYTEGLLSSPSQFYSGDWLGFARDNMLPSPMNLQTPLLPQASDTAGSGGGGGGGSGSGTGSVGGNGGGNGNGKRSPTSPDFDNIVKRPRSR